MAKYTKSYSNYVLKSKHQTTKDGTIFERDITTIGARENMTSGQIPIYRTGNFVITVNDERTNNSTVSPSSAWETNKGSDIWTLATMEGNAIDPTASDDRTIKLKKDIYDLRDFAYYGSSTELLRASISDIFKKFPAEFYLPYSNITIYRRYVKHDEEGIETVTVETYYSEEDVIKTYGDISVTGETTPTSRWDSVSYQEGAPAYYYTSEGPKRLGCKSSAFLIAPEESENTPESGHPTTTVVKSVDLDPDETGRFDESGEYGNCLSMLDNPFGLDMLNDNGFDEFNSLKYLLTNSTFSKYEIITEDGKHLKFSLTKVDDGEGVENHCQGDLVGTVNLKVYNLNTSFEVDPNDASFDSSTSTFNIGQGSSTISPNINASQDSVLYNEAYGGSEGFNIYAYLGNDNKIFYLVDLEEWEPLLGCHIRPLPEYYEYFYDTLDYFEQVLVDPDTDPKYTAKLHIIKENEFGKETHFDSFMFPTTLGGYNLCNGGGSLTDYIQRFSRLTNEYDETCCDNLWRSMTHEAIKNLDWSSNKEEDAETYGSAYGRVEKTIRVIGRFFDNIKWYIDNLKNVNRVTYDDVNNLPDYFFTDKVGEMGWDAVQVLPYNLNEFVERISMANTDEPYDRPTLDLNINNGNAIQPTSNNTSFAPSGSYNTPVQNSVELSNLQLTGITTGIKPSLNGKGFPVTTIDAFADIETMVAMETTNGYAMGMRVIRKFSQATDTDDVVTPYYGHIVKTGFYGCFGGEFKWVDDDGDKEYTLDEKGNVLRRVSQMTYTKQYTFPEVNNEFYKRLILNSKAILRKKGTIEGIESILSMFGMRSKRYADLMGEANYDFSVSEYVVTADSPLIDTYDESIESYVYEKINDSKEIVYDTIQYRNGIPFPYQGLPVIYTEDEDTKTRTIYPNFDSTDIYDGSPYYQMSGGWMRKYPFVYDEDYNIVVTSGGTDVYDETIKSIRIVNNIKELVSLQSEDVDFDDIVYVRDISGKNAIVDGVVYDLFKDSDASSAKTFFFTTVTGNSVTVGQTKFEGGVVVSDPYAPNGLRKYYLGDNNLDGKQIRVYVNQTTTGAVATAYSDTNSIMKVSVYDGNKLERNGYTHYFQIQDPFYTGEISSIGWKQLSNLDKEYLKVNCLKNDFNGNNPHTGTFKYDNGTDYLRIFTKLFRYPIDNDLFNSEVYVPINGDSDGTILENMIDNFGFSISGVDKDDKCHMDYPVIEDRKIYVACDLLKKNSDNTYTELKAKDYLVTDNGTINNIPAKAPLTNLIINTKRLDITFKLKNESLFSNDGQCERMYIDKVIMPYLSQMIPSQTIVRINYINS